MARRKAELFNLSLLDLLTSALGAVIFLFIITPKNGQPAAATQQALIYLDTTEMKLYGDLADSLKYKQTGDTLFALVLDHKPLPKPKEPGPKKIIIEQPTAPKPIAKVEAPKPKPTTQPKPEQPKPKPVESKPEKPSPEVAPKPVTYRGDAPSVPCNLSIEISWPNKAENIDLRVCKGSRCVFGGRKKDKSVGQWDSGRSRNRLFGNDLRTNQEAVRQFDDIIPGEYKIYASFKESNRNRTAITIKGLIYTKAANGQERGQAFTQSLKLNQENKLIGTLVVKADGSFQLKR